MRALVIYDSVYGNTERIALAIGKALGNQEDVAVLKVRDVMPAQFAGSQLVIVGSPTQRFNQTMDMNNLLD